MYTRAHTHTSIVHGNQFYPPIPSDLDASDEPVKRDAYIRFRLFLLSTTRQ